MPDVKSSITSHNAKILNPPENTNDSKKCNCKVKDNCPLNGNCLIKDVVYMGTLTNSTSPTTHYIGMTERPFKVREREHWYSFKDPKKKLASKLSAYIWSQKSLGEEQTTISWSIIDRAPAYRNGYHHCRLCLTEKFHIIFQPVPTINKRNEIVSKCRHENKFLLANVK